MDWDTIDFVVFDVDGTLYDQRPLRRRLAWNLATNTFLRGDFLTTRVIRIYRNLRENLAEMEVENFASRLLHDTAAATGVRPATVEKIIAEWMLQRPLRHLPPCRYPKIDDLFNGLTNAGKIIGILSDYPAQEKMRALTLEANFIVTADDVGRLKPHPLGLATLIAQARTTPERTLLIGDRYERDGIAAERVGAHYLIRTAHPTDNNSFARFDDPVFAPMLTCIS